MATATNGAHSPEGAEILSEVISEALADTATDRHNVIDLRSGDPIVRIDDTPPRVVVSRADSAYVRFVKPVVDRIAGTLAVIVFSPIMLGVALAIRLSMGKKVLFLQDRVGKDGKVFKVIKFRTMRHDRRAAQRDYNGPDRRLTHKTEADPRHTPVGRFLRKWSLDELPQFINVAKGDMSLVGPRPEMVSIVEKYQPWQHDRHQVRPGITGIWQISERGDVPLHEATELDIDYIEQVSLGTDLKILLRTIPAALGRSQGS